MVVQKAHDSKLKSIKLFNAIISEECLGSYSKCWLSHSSTLHSSCTWHLPHLEWQAGEGESLARAFLPWREPHSLTWSSVAPWLKWEPELCGVTKMQLRRREANEQIILIFCRQKILSGWGHGACRAFWCVLFFRVFSLQALLFKNAVKTFC